MKRSDYLNTIEGQLSIRRKRQLNALYFMLDGQEPKSKNAISTSEKIAFQSTILKDLKRLNRRHFRAPIALECDFTPAENDPPAIHTLPKNYLDLLAKPVPGVNSNWKRLVFDDDRKVRYLAVKYRIRAERPEPGISLKVAPYRDFVADMALLHKVENNSLETVSDALYHRRSSITWENLTKDDEDRHDNDAIGRLREHESNKLFWIRKYGKNVYEAWHEMYMMEVQNHLLKTLALSPSSLIHLLSPLFLDLPEKYEDILSISRSNIIGPPVTIDLKHSDLKQGESSQYKAFVKETIAAFKKEHNILFPLRTKVGITILFQPPAARSIDLDNLARRIVPFVNDELKPPSSLLLTVDAERGGDPKLRKWFIEKKNALKRMPKHSITHYQVVQMPRLTKDSEHGFVRLLLEPGEQIKTLWAKMEDLIDRWQAHVER